MTPCLYVIFVFSPSILYADIVNFTPLSSSCSPAELVSLLNELFGRFDKQAQQHNCTRIKFLGDCYYCVSGLPTPQPCHARNCVEMGLDMLDTIKEVRAATGSEIDMRIGIHTGVVLSGVIGLKKWQYDVWSDDVVIANCLESCGSPGMIHISKTTLQELDGRYQVVEANSRRNSTLVDKNIETYLIQTVVKQEESEAIKNRRISDQLKSVIVSAINIASFLTSCGEPKPFCTTPEAVYAEKVVMSSISQMEKSFEIIKNPRYVLPHCKRIEGLNWLAVNLTDMKTETQCWQSSDKYFIRGALVVCAINILLLSLSFLIDKGNSSFFKPLLGSLTAFYGLVFVVLWIILYFNKSKLVKFHKIKCPVKVIKLKLFHRIIIFGVLILGLYLLSLITVASSLSSSPSEINVMKNQSNQLPEVNQNSSVVTRTERHQKGQLFSFLFFGDITLCLGIFSCTLFLQITYVFKFPTVIFLTAAHIVIVFIIRGKLSVTKCLTAESLLTSLLFLTAVFVVLRRVGTSCVSHYFCFYMMVFFAVIYFRSPPFSFCSLII